MSRNTFPEPQPDSASEHFEGLLTTWLSHLFLSITKAIYKKKTFHSKKEIILFAYKTFFMPYSLKYDFVTKPKKRHPKHLKTLYLCICTLFLRTLRACKVCYVLK